MDDFATRHAVLATGLLVACVVGTSLVVACVVYASRWAEARTSSLLLAAAITTFAVALRRTRRPEERQNTRSRT